MEQERVADQKLTGAEALVMKVVWETKDEYPTMIELIEEINKRLNKTYTRTTVATFLRRIEEKGYITHRRTGRYTYWAPIIKEEDYIQEVFNDFVDLWLDHDVSKLETLINSYK